MNRFPKKYFLNYDLHPLCEVDISDTAIPAIKEMVEFWGNWEEDIAAEIEKPSLDETDPFAKDDQPYVARFLKNLAMFLLRWDRIPGEGGYDDEGWFRMDGTQGIKVSEFYEFEFDEENIEIS